MTTVAASNTNSCSHRHHYDNKYPLVSSSSSSSSSSSTGHDDVATTVMIFPSVSLTSIPIHSGSNIPTVPATMATPTMTTTTTTTSISPIIMTTSTTTTTYHNTTAIMIAPIPICCSSISHDDDNNTDHDDHHLVESSSSITPIGDDIATLMMPRTPQVSPITIRQNTCLPTIIIYPQHHEEQSQQQDAIDIPTTTTAAMAPTTMTLTPTIPITNTTSTTTTMTNHTSTRILPSPIPPNHSSVTYNINDNDDHHLRASLPSSSSTPPTVYDVASPKVILSSLPPLGSGVLPTILIHPQQSHSQQQQSRQHIIGITAVTTVMTPTTMAPTSPVARNTTGTTMMTNNNNTNKTNNQLSKFALHVLLFRVKWNDSRIKELLLNYNIGILSTMALSNTMKYNRNIVTLKFDYNNQLSKSIVCMNAIASMIRTNSTLQVLSLNHCHIGDYGIKVISNALISKNSSKLKELYLEYNSIGNDGAESLALALGQQQHYKYCDHHTNTNYYDNTNNDNDDTTMNHNNMYNNYNNNYNLVDMNNMTTTTTTTEGATNNNNQGIRGRRKQRQQNRKIGRKSKTVPFVDVQQQEHVTNTNSMHLPYSSSTITTNSILRRKKKESQSTTPTSSSSSLSSSCSIRILSLKSNRISDRGAIALAYSLRHNEIIRILYLDDNNMNDIGGITFRNIITDYNDTILNITMHYNHLTNHTLGQLEQLLLYNSNHIRIANVKGLIRRHMIYDYLMNNTI